MDLKPFLVKLSPTINHAEAEMERIVFLFLLMPFFVNGQDDSLTTQIKLEAKRVYIKAYADVTELRMDVNLAKEGKVLKQSVVNHFNKIMGSVMGNLTSFSEVDKRLKAAGDAYIEFMFKKECSRIALEKAAELDYKAKQKLEN